MGVSLHKWVNCVWVSVHRTVNVCTTEFLHECVSVHINGGLYVCKYVHASLWMWMGECVDVDG